MTASSPQSLQPIAIGLRGISLLEAHAERVLGAEPEGGSAASVRYGVSAMEYDNDGVFDVVTVCDVTLKNGAGETMARLRTRYSTELSVNRRFPSAPETRMIGRIQLAVAEATHAYHRGTLISLSEQFDIPTYRMPIGFDREAFTENFFAEAEKLVSASGGNDQVEPGRSVAEAERPKIGSRGPRRVGSGGIDSPE